MGQMICRVCRAPAVNQFVRDRAGRLYHRCPDCHATLLDPACFLSRQEELAHYQTHQNTVEDAGYRAFLGRLANPLLAVLPARCSGLDYGCGPGPALAAMMREAGHEVAVYDPFFAPDKAPLDARHDFITCTETAEHFQEPAREFAGLARMLRPGGVLAIMTTFQDDDDRFLNWHYRLDPTHVVFYRKETLAAISRQHGLSCSFPCANVCLMHAPAGE